MSQSLQTDERATGGPTTAFRTTELVIDDNYISKALACFADAKNEVRMCAYAWRWYENEPEIGIQKFNIRLLELQRRGVKVRIIVDVQSAVEQFRRLGFNVRSVEKNKMLHTKALCIDQKSLIIGSHNHTKRASSDNYEMSLITQEFEPIAQFTTYFDALWSRCG